jgi:hypothetical protein
MSIQLFAPARLHSKERTPCARHLNDVRKFILYFTLSSVRSVKTNRLVLFREIMAVYCGNCRKQLIAVCCGNCRKHVNEDNGAIGGLFLPLGWVFTTPYVNMVNVAVILRVNVYVILT